MKQVHRANTRGISENNWLNSQHSFSFADYYNPDRSGVGKLRVLNDDAVQASKGFGMHSHSNMEIVSIPLSGSLLHKDNMGNEHIIKTGDVQILSAGSGIRHSEYNPSPDTAVEFLQIWILPKALDIEPSYDQKTYDQAKMKNRFLPIVSSLNTDKNTVSINQDAIFSLAILDAGSSISYNTHFKSASCYLFVIDGEIDIAGENLQEKDAIALTSTSTIDMISIKASKLLCIETA